MLKELTSRDLASCTATLPAEVVIPEPDHEFQEEEEWVAEPPDEVARGKLEEGRRRRDGDEPPEARIRHPQVLAELRERDAARDEHPGRAEHPGQDDAEERIAHLRRRHAARGSARQGKWGFVSRGEGHPFHSIDPSDRSDLSDQSDQPAGGRAGSS